MHLLRPLTFVALALVLPGCVGGDDVGGDETATTGATNGSTVGNSSTSVGPGTATSTTTTDPETTSVGTTTTDDSTTTGMTEPTGTTTTSTTTGDDTTTGDACLEPPFDPDPPGAGGAMCFMDAECGDGERCFVVPLLGGICGECLVDADCPEGGCTLPNPLAGVGAVCNTGKPGGGCETDEVCESTCNNLCGVALDATPILKVSTCGACKTSDDCTKGAICTPSVNLSEFSGINTCAPPGSIANGETCSLGPGGGEACVSGKCATASIMGVVQVGVCGECLGPEDCAPDQSCSDAYVDVNTSEFFPSVCE